MQRRRAHYKHSKKVPLPMQAVFMPFEKAMQAVQAVQLMPPMQRRRVH